MASETPRAKSRDEAARLVLQERIRRMAKRLEELEKRVAELERQREMDAELLA